MKAGEAAGVPKEWELWPEGEDKAVKRTSELSNAPRDRSSAVIQAPSCDPYIRREFTLTRTGALRSRFPFHFAYKSLIAQSHRLRQQAARPLRNVRAFAPASSGGRETMGGNDKPVMIGMSNISAHPESAQPGGIEDGAAFQVICQGYAHPPLLPTEKCVYRMSAS